MKAGTEKQIPSEITYIWTLKSGTNEPVYTTETSSQTWSTDLRLPRGKEWVGDRVLGSVDANSEMENG